MSKIFDIIDTLEAIPVAVIALPLELPLGFAFGLRGDPYTSFKNTSILDTDESYIGMLLRRGIGYVPETIGYGLGAGLRYAFIGRPTQPYLFR